LVLVVVVFVIVLDDADDVVTGFDFTFKFMQNKNSKVKPFLTDIYTLYLKVETRNALWFHNFFKEKASKILM